MTEPSGDDWFTPSTSSLTNIHQPSKGFPIKDDWEDSDDEEEPPAQNPAPLTPPPPPVIGAPPPRAPVPLQANSIPAAAFQPAFTILKRPASNPNQQVKKDSGEGRRDDFIEREARYREARERIFGDSTPASSTTSLDLKRQPKGPEEGDSKGFKGRTRQVEKDSS